jgi:hypothetical protein
LGGILLSIAAYLVIAIPGLYNKSIKHVPNLKSILPYHYNIGMWKLDNFGSSLSVVGIIGIILFALAFTSTIGGIILRNGGRAVSTKLMITSLVILFVTTLIFIMIIISKPNHHGESISLIWGDVGDSENPAIFSFSNYG